VLGASDAGVYVGQSENVTIKNNTVYWNVAGIESENSENVIIEGNTSYENTGGILIFDLPGLTRYGKNIKAYNNNVHDNNLKNFAPSGNIVGFVPPGTGFLILATRDVEIYDNEVKDNKTIGVGIVSYDLVAEMRNESSDENRPSGAQGVNQNYKKDTNYDPYPRKVRIHNNNLSNSYILPDLGNDFGKLFLYKFKLSPPQIAWDGIESANYNLGDGSVNPDYRICVDENEKVKVAILDAANDFKNLTTDPAKLKCDI
jgi:parallel beta-helix repeat protein